MESLTVFGLIGFALAFYALSKIEKLNGRVKKLEEYLQNDGYIDEEKESLKRILGRNIGAAVKLEIENEDCPLFDVSEKPCILLDMDEIWLHLRLQKKQEEYLVRVETVKSVVFLEEEKTC